MSVQQTPSQTMCVARQRLHSSGVRSTVHCASPCSVALALTCSSPNATRAGDSAAAASIRPFSLSRALFRAAGSEKLLGLGSSAAAAARQAAGGAVGHLGVREARGEAVHRVLVRAEGCVEEAGVGGVHVPEGVPEPEQVGLEGGAAAGGGGGGGAVAAEAEQVVAAVTGVQELSWGERGS